MKGSLLLAFLFTTDMLSVGSEEAFKSMPTILEYFPELNGDLTKVEWAHAVNSVSLLEKALSDKKVMMLEADVVLGTLKGGKDEKIPVMAHPPSTTSDLSLEMFLKAAINAQKEKRKGIKLDFKSTESFLASCKVVDVYKNQMQFPVLLNADIFPGPINSSVKPVDSDVFLRTSSKYPGTTLSLGWTTRFGPGMSGVYTKEQLETMSKAIRLLNIMQPVTFCLRAGIAAKSSGIKNLVDEIDEIELVKKSIFNLMGGCQLYLVHAACLPQSVEEPEQLACDTKNSVVFQKSKKTSVTIWMSSNTDPVDVPKLRELIFMLNKSKVLLDVPKFIRDKLALDKNSATTPINAAQGALVALLTSISAVFSNMF